jgi:predicted deacylase
LSFEVCGVKAEPGTKRSRMLKAAELPIGNVEVPLTVINGAEPGPTLLLSAGIHGTEYPGIKAAQIMAQETDPSRLAGRMMIVHCANVPMFNAITAFVNPIDHINFNRIFPGEPKSTGFYGPGSISHHVTNFIYEQVMKRSTHFIDLHGGDLPEHVPLFSISFEMGDEEKDLVTRNMLKYTLADFVDLRPQGGSLTTTGAASRAGIPHTLIESGGGGVLRKEFVDRHFRGVRNIMRYLGMLEGTPEEPTNQRTMDGRRAGLRAKRGGLFMSFVEAGEVVAEGQVIGEITNAFGEVVEELRSPIGGVVTIINFPAAKNVGDPIFDISGIR